MYSLLKVRIVFLFSSLIFALQGQSQIAYSENFGTGCSTGTLATTFGWTNTNTGTNNVNANIWYVSAAENGVGAGNCGVGCGGANSRTLHVGAEASVGGDLGAAYFESSAFICGFLGLCSVTDKRIESPTIDCSGLSTITLSFDYIENGEGANDNATVWYSANNGITWIQIDDPPKSTLCGGQGLWATRTLTLPASADNNPTIKIAFRWVNNGNGTAVDPSFAVDNILIEVPIVLSVEMISMNVICDVDKNIVQWLTKSELNISNFNVYGSSDGINWSLLQSVQALNSNQINHYEITDSRVNNLIRYYYIEEIDNDGTKKSFAIFSSVPCQSNFETLLFPNPSNSGELTISSKSENIELVEIYSVDGKLVFTYQNSAETNMLQIETNLPPGEYFVRVMSFNDSNVLRWIITDSYEAAN